MIEDEFHDVLGKAIRGQGFDVRSLNLDAVRLGKCLSGEFDEEMIRSLAPALSLNADRLLKLPFYQPEVSFPSSVKCFISPFGHIGVNAFIVENDTHILIFDTGTDAQESIDYISKFPEKEKHLFITHPHADHISCEAEILHYVISRQLLEPGKSLVFGNLTLSSLDVAGHCLPATAYFIEGLNSPLCIVGDAIFAGSIGAVKQVPHYKLALANIHNNILTLPKETILLSGHGPATTIDLEMQHNPFF